jgi:hypothetical protein
MMYNKRMIFMKKNWRKIVLVASVSILPIISFAATCPDGTPSDGRICNPIGTPGATASLPAFIRTILNGFLTIGIPLVALAVIYCGFLFVFARGNSEKLTKAKDSLLWTLVGAGVLLGAWAIAQMISATVTGLGTP